MTLPHEDLYEERREWVIEELWAQSAEETS